MVSRQRLTTCGLGRSATGWWFFPDLTADEALPFKLHDTDHSVAWRCPYTAFEAPYAADANPRESVEFRTIAFVY